MKLITKLSLFLLPLFLITTPLWADGNDANTVSLLHMDGDDASPTFTDSAAGGTHTWTARGNAQIDTAQSKFGGASGLFDGTGDSIDTPDSNDWNYGTGNFTYDFWVRFADLSANGGILYCQRLDANNQINLSFYADGGTNDYIQWQVYDTGTQVLRFYVATADLTINPWAINTWYHIALVRESSADLATSWGLYINGTRQTLTKLNGNWNATMPDIGAILELGTRAAAEYLNGWLDEVRISKGVARWTANFTPPTSAYSIAIAPKGQIIWIE